MTRSGVRLPSAPPIFSNTLKIQEKSKQCEPNVANCDRRLVHKRSSTIPKSPLPSTDLDGSDWRRSVVHNPRDKSRTHVARSSSPPSPRSSRNVPGLIVRGRVFYLRLRVPRTLQGKVGRSHFWRSLGTSKWDEAVREARLVGAQFETLLRQAEGRSLPPVRFDHDLRDVGETILPTVPTKAGKTLREVFELHQNDPSKVRTPKTALAYANTFEVIGAVIDLDTPTCDISRDDCRRLLETLRWVPSNTSKRYPKLNIVQAAEMAKRKKLTSTLNPATINACASMLFVEADHILKARDDAFFARRVGGALRLGDGELIKLGAKFVEIDVTDHSDLHPYSARRRQPLRPAFAPTGRRRKSKAACHVPA